MDRYNVEITFIEPLIGTVPMNKEIYSDFVESKKPPEIDDDEVDTVIEALEKGVTGFHVNGDEEPILYDYVIKGFFKDACGMLRRVTDTRSKKVTAYKKIIDGLVFVKPRQIVISGGQKGMIERPLRAITAKGERVALAKSEIITDIKGKAPWMEFEVHVLGQVKENLLREWLNYGALRGLGQWRNAGYGSFTYQMEKLEPEQ